MFFYSRAATSSLPGSLFPVAFSFGTDQSLLSRSFEFRNYLSIIADYWLLIQPHCIPDFVLIYISCAPLHPYMSICVKINRFASVDKSIGVSYIFKCPCLTYV